MGAMEIVSAILIQKVVILSTAPYSTVLTAIEEAMIVEFRQRTLLPLDDVLGCMRDIVH